MIDKKSDVIYNKKYLVIVPYLCKDLYESFRFSFDNVILMEKNISDVDNILKFINRNNFKQLIFVDYLSEYDQIINNLINSSEIKFIFTKALGSLSNSMVYESFSKIDTFYQNKIVSSIAFLDRNFYEALKNKYKSIYHIVLDVERNKKINNDKYECTIGLLNDDINSCHSFYNELSAIKLLNDYVVKVLNPSKVTKSFVKLFDIRKKYVNSYSKLISSNVVNLYINFTDNNMLNFIKSMDCGVPCILGNNDLIDQSSKLGKNLIVKSDDNIDEIAAKILNVIKNRREILDDYKEFRDDYAVKSRKSISKFLDFVVSKKTDYSYDKLISIIVPVYNTECYLEKSLESIINACVDDCEIIVINDGSVDNSEDIILRYKKKYPELIRYIKQENRGLGNVRNVGLHEAKGKYIVSIDSDDTVDPNFLNDALDYLEDDVDVVICDWMTVTDDSDFETPALDPSLNNLNLYEGLLYTTIMPSTCNKIIKKRLFDDLKISYIEDKYEDLSTNPFIMLSAETIKYIRKPYYKYYIRSNSIMRSSAGYSMINVINELDERIAKYSDIFNCDIDKFKYYTYAWRIEEFIMNQLYSISDSELEDYMNYIYDKLYDTMVSIFNSYYYEDMLNKINNKSKREFIKERNKSFEVRSLNKFIKDCRKNSNFYMLTPVVMFYGECND